MFNKKPRRNFRQRKGDSSDEDEQKNGEGDDLGKTQVTADSIKPSKSSQIKSDSSGAEDVVEDSGPFAVTRSPHSKENKDGRNKINVLSFSDDKARRDVTVVASPKEQSGSDVSGEELSPESDGDAKSTTSTSASSMSSRSSKSSRSSMSSTQKHKPVVIPDTRRIQAARRQRQKARAQKDHISLGRDWESSPRTPDHEDLEERSDEDNDDDDTPDDHE